MSDVTHDPLGTLIGEIAAKHGIAVSRDDPLLIIQTVFRHLMTEGETAQREALEQFKEEMEGVSLRWSVDAQGKADRVLTAALSESRNAMTQAIEEGAKAAVKSVQAELGMARKALEHDRLVTRRYAVYAIGASLVSSFVMLGSVTIWLLFK